jgi:hypothetical protein
MLMNDAMAMDAVKNFGIVNANQYRLDFITYSRFPLP